jgi:crotonobetainyl-CoA:carnitine CoA-transferase CaiB-like acyl-CoA transferase
LFFFHNNTNKLGITLNLEHEDGKEIFLKLLQKADILVETFPPDYLRQGLGFEFLGPVNKGLIHVSVTGFGKNGLEASINHATW